MRIDWDRMHRDLAAEFDNIRNSLIARIGLAEIIVDRKPFNLWNELHVVVALNNYPPRIDLLVDTNGVKFGPVIMERIACAVADIVAAVAVRYNLQAKHMYDLNYKLCPKITDYEEEDDRSA